ncbi:protein MICRORCHIDIA 6-like [Gastrolobium bilobum]|uniref:protein MICRORCHIDIA 6-like n=1 Tax=Gastrolobium bilobum TaxID=150636 RepID=UPI002AAFA728|nr:protein MICRORCHIDIA 6-like [Gastrolobium bilobum]
MGTIEIVDLSSDDEGENHSPRAVKECHSHSGILEQSFSPVDDSGLSCPQSLCAAPICRQFWKAGNYDNGFGSEVSEQNAGNYLHVHPLFLHSNATSHKWAFGAIAELLDNAVDEVQNGATFVIVDKISNPKDGSPALLIRDNGAGMDPEAMRRCMSFGFSDKKSKFAIGQYGNGFKTGSMRLGADAIVFSRHLNNMILTQSIGLLSYTFLMRTQLDRIVVPMVNYEFNSSTESLEILNGREHFRSNLSMLLNWSPYSSEAELMKQFDDIGSHGTKIIIFNLWFNDDGNLELDFDTDPEDIRIAGDIKKIDTMPAKKIVNEQHIANRFHYSLRVYLSILYLRIPESFRIILRGKVVKLHNIADDLKYPEFILYRPQSGVSEKATVVTTIGFLKEAPEVNIHGFTVYHKNRLILPFWQVVDYSSNNRGRGVVGILQADYIEPTHNKQDFERTSLFQKLEVRLKEMTWEYWDYHCQLIGYQRRKPQTVVSPLDSSLKKPPASLTKRKAHGFIDLHSMKKQAMEENVRVVGCNQSVQTIASPAGQEAINLMEINKKLIAKCLEYEKGEEELNLKVTQLRSKIKEAQLEYDRLLAEVQSLL